MRGNFCCYIEKGLFSSLFVLNCADICYYGTLVVVLVAGEGYFFERYCGMVTWKRLLTLCSFKCKEMSMLSKKVSLVVCVGILVCLASSVLAEDYDGPISGILIVDGTGDPGTVAVANIYDGATTAGYIQVNAGGEVNLYGGEFTDEFGGGTYDGWFEITIAGGIVTFYGTSFTIGGVEIAEGTTSALVTTYPAGGYGFRNVEWTDEAGNSYNIWVDSLVPVYFSPLGEPEPPVKIVDIKPDSEDNTLNLGSNGVVPVAFYGSATLDVENIIVESIGFEGEGGAVALRGKKQNALADIAFVNDDEYPDLIVKIPTSLFAYEVLEEGEVYDAVCHFTAVLTDDSLLEGSDFIRIVHEVPTE